MSVLNEAGDERRLSEKHGLGVVDTSLLVVGSIVGAGIFFVSQDVAQDVRSPAAFLGAWVLGGVVALSGALSSGELGGLFPRSGGEYVYLREAYGPSLGFLSGWTSFWIAFPGSIAALAAAFGDTVAELLGMGVGASLPIGAGAIVALTVVNALGLQSGKWTQNALSAIKLAAFAVLLGLGFFVHARVTGGVGGVGGVGADGAASASGLTPFFVAGDDAKGIATALIPVLFAYSGWNAATYVTGEMRDPKRGLWRALALGTGLCVALYIAVNVVFLRGLTIDALAHADQPARAAALRLGGPAAAAVLVPLIAVCTAGSLQATVLVGPRIYQAMAADGLFFRALGRIHPRTKVPVAALVVQGLVSVVQLVGGSLGRSNVFGRLVTFSVFAIVVFSMLTTAAVFVLRVRRPDAERPFRVPGYPIVPAIFVAVNAWLLWSMIDRSLSMNHAYEPLIGAAIVATGLPAYAVFRARARLTEPSR